MNRILVALFVFLFGLSASGGVILTLENDLVNETDDSYSHGTEIEWVGGTQMKNDSPYRVGYGIHQTMYTPTDISNPDNQPDDRPWCGMLTAFREVWSKSGTEVVRTRYEVGVLGPWAGCETTQTKVHEIVGSGKPMGWDNQMPNEPVVNVYHERHHPLMSFGREGSWGAYVESVYGGTLGTTFINAMGGSGVRAGWNIPPDRITGGIDPKGIQAGRFFAYVSGEVGGIFVLHNATIGSSFFQDREPDHEQELQRGVGTYKYGGVVGYGSFAATYMFNMRTAEFKGQDEGTDWGMVSLEFVDTF